MGKLLLISGWALPAEITQAGWEGSGIHPFLICSELWECCPPCPEPGWLHAQPLCWQALTHLSSTTSWHRWRSNYSALRKAMLSSVVQNCFLVSVFKNAPCWVRDNLSVALKLKDFCFWERLVGPEGSGMWNSRWKQDLVENKTMKVSTVGMPCPSLMMGDWSSKILFIWLGWTDQPKDQSEMVWGFCVFRVVLKKNKNWGLHGKEEFM